MGMRKVICKNFSTLEFEWVRLPFDNGYEKNGLQHFELCTVVWVSNTPNFQMGIEKWFAIFRVMHSSLGEKDT